MLELVETKPSRQLCAVVVQIDMSVSLNLLNEFRCWTARGGTLVIATTCYTPKGLSFQPFWYLKIGHSECRLNAKGCLRTVLAPSRAKHPGDAGRARAAKTESESGRQSLTWSARKGRSVCLVVVIRLLNVLT